MVQIILSLTVFTSVYYLLYIPHGSDNTLTLNLHNIVAEMLYIPHGSDNTEKKERVKSSHVCTLYPTWFR